MNPNPQRGQALLLATALLGMAALLALFLFQVGLTVREKIRLQTAADLALLSALNTQANSLNSLALCNRTTLAHDALAGRLNALVSESAFIRRMLEGVGWLVKLIPYVGPVLGSGISQGGRALERACLQAAQTGIPAVAPANAAFAAQAQAVRLSLVPLPFSAAAQSAKANAPGATISPLTQAVLLRQGVALSRAIRPLPAEETTRLVEQTLDPHSRKRDWKLWAGALPVRKTGGTAVESSDFRSFDRLEFKIFKKGKWRWKKIIATESTASRFGYKGHGGLLGLEEDAVPKGLTLLLTQKAPSTPGWFAPPPIPLSAVSSGRLLYRRETRPAEPANLFNPFWTARLIPVAEEEGAGKLVPKPLLKKVLH